jgi:hypothetical protein
MINLHDTTAPLPAVDPSPAVWFDPADDVEARARVIAALHGRIKPEFDDRAQAWSERLERGWLQASAEIPLSTFFRLVCASAVRALRVSGRTPLRGQDSPAASEL